VPSGMVAVILRIAVLAALAGALASGQDDADGPDHGVARISVVEGDVSVRRGDSGEWIAAAANAPAVAGDQLVTGSSSRAELQFDWSNMLRVGADSDVRLAELEYHRYLIQVARGTITWRVLRDQDAYAEISAPTVSVRPVRGGTYRLTVAANGFAEITVRSGEAEIFTARGSQRLSSGRTMLVQGNSTEPEFRIVNEGPRDEWDQWNESRDRQLSGTQSYNYVSPDVYGAEDLDQYGQWLNAPSYGWVWAPRVAQDWAPYRLGRWAWLDWYGWSWVSHDPWGWAPYHYGRWFYYANRGWCWYPGGTGTRQYWAPAHVAFFGLAGTGTGWGRVGWVPLAPSEPLHRWWGARWYNEYRHPGYVNSLPFRNDVNITSMYRNSRIDRGFTIVDQEGFRRGQPGSAGRIGDTNGRQLTVAQGPVPVAPARESQRVSPREPGPVPSNPRGLTGPDRFFSNRRPAPIDRVPFEDQRRGMEIIANRPAAGEGWRRFGSTGGRPNGLVEPGSAGRDDVWRFGGRRGGDRGTSTQPAPVTTDRWERFGSALGSSGTPAARQGSSINSGGNSRTDGGRGASRGESIRITPPMVRERSGPGPSPGSSNFGRGASGSSSAPPRSAGSGGRSGGHSGGRGR